ncbi:MAG: PD-(D/E)XK nuclease family protein, partial [Elusimicrobiota bacterium]
YFSYSKMSLYKECPLKYKFKYIDKIKEKPKPYFAFGHSIHAALEFLYAVKSPPFPSLAELLETFKNDWNKKNYLEKGYTDPAKAEKDFYEGLRMLTAYYKKHHKTFALEIPFILEYDADVLVDNLVVKIVVDKINYAGKGEILIIDYKTGKDVKREPDQLYMYQKILEIDPSLKERIFKTYGDSVEKVKVRHLMYYHVPTLKEVRFNRASDTEINKFWDEALNTAECIKSGKFDPSPGEMQCKFCDYKQMCPVIAKKEITRTVDSVPSEPEKTSTANSMKPDDRIKDMIDEYAELNGQMEQLKSRMEILKSKILAFSKTQDGQIEGRNYAVEVRQTEKWNFKDRDLIIKVLKEINLFEKTLAPVLKNILSILDDSEISEQVKEKIKNAGEKISEFELIIKKLI